MWKNRNLINGYGFYILHVRVYDFSCLCWLLQYNNWFTFSEYEEAVTARSCRPIHARELAMVRTIKVVIVSFV